MKITNIFKHFHTINKHRFWVFVYSVKAGIPFRGLMHDLSKYSIEEFFTSCKYYQGNKSPISEEKEVEGFSKVWLHHKGRNKHHYEYWYDYNAPEKTPIIPYKYAAEMICDGLSASKVYNGKNWTNKSQITYWNNTRPTRMINPKIEGFLTEVYTLCSENGIDATLNSKNLKKIYNKYVNNEENNKEE